MTVNAEDFHGVNHRVVGTRRSRVEQLIRCGDGQTQRRRREGRKDVKRGETSEILFGILTNRQDVKRLKMADGNVFSTRKKRKFTFRWRSERTRKREVKSIEALSDTGISTDAL